MSIHSQDTQELMQHIEVSWQSIQDTIKELHSRRIAIELTLNTGKRAFGHELLRSQWKATPVEEM
jgi:hypothetical protein